MFNVSQVLYRNAGDGCFHSRLAVDAAERARLLAGRKEIRNCLRKGIAELTRAAFGASRVVTPRFLTQGSFAYGTLNDPAQHPPQEIDLDDGTYLPMSLMKGAAPSDVSDVYFSIVDGLVGELARRQGWKIDKTRSTCTRVHISKRAHIDVPMYAIPDSEYRTLVEKSAMRGFVTVEAAFRDGQFSDWALLDSDSIWLAVRGGKWVKSDPRKIHAWVMQQGRIFPQYIRICRYLKAWRDQQWEKGGPSSILLMVCASQALESHAGRDDKALLSVAQSLATMLAGGVCNPQVDPEAELNQLTAYERQIACQKARTLTSKLTFAMEQATDAAGAIASLSSVLGPRVPNRVDWVQNVAAGTVLATPATVVAAPAVKRARSA